MNLKLDTKHTNIQTKEMMKYAEQVAEIHKDLHKRAKDKKITKVIFDRGGYLYHGRVEALAEAARANGLEF